MPISFGGVQLYHRQHLSPRRCLSCQHSLTTFTHTHETTHSYFTLLCFCLFSNPFSHSQALSHVRVCCCRCSSLISSSALLLRSVWHSFLTSVCHSNSYSLSSLTSRNCKIFLLSKQTKKTHKTDIHPSLPPPSLPPSIPPFLPPILPSPQHSRPRRRAGACIHVLRRILLEVDGGRK